jgi:hypothetical protein
MELEIIVLSKISWNQKNKGHIFPFICGILKNDKKIEG